MLWSVVKKKKETQYDIENGIISINQPIIICLEPIPNKRYLMTLSNLSR